LHEDIYRSGWPQLFRHTIGYTNMKTFPIFLFLSSLTIGFASTDPCQLPQKIESQDKIFIGRLIKEELLEKELKIKIAKRHIDVFQLTKLTFIVDTILYGSTIDTVLVFQSFGGEGNQNFLVGAQYCMHAKYTETIQYLFDTIPINGYMSFNCLMRLNVTFVKGVPLNKGLIDNISEYCVLPKSRR